MPNAIAYLALVLWPLAALAIYGRMRADQAFIWTLLLGYLLLPEPPAAFDLPLLPAFDKHNIPVIAAFAIALGKYGFDEPLLPRDPVCRVLVFVFVFSPIFTVMTNLEPVIFGRVGLPGLSVTVAIALVIQQFLLILPFLMARRFLGSGGSQRALLRALLIGGLVYSVLMLVEIRLSPQLNNWIYGYYQHFFGQSIRFGGFRPVVFLYHGLWVALFCLMATIAAFALWRFDRQGSRMTYLAAALYLSAVLVMAKSLGALIFLVMMVPLVVLMSPIWQIRSAVIVALVVTAYPILKGAALVPEERLIEAAASVQQDRAASLQFRFDNENTLLERAYEKALFGWGSWGRNHILDPVTGDILTVTDGRWIIVIGVYGWVGFLAEFGLMLWPLLLVWRQQTSGGAVSPLVAPLSLLLAFNMLDMIPNATLTTLTWILAGALLGYAEAPRHAEDTPEPIRRDGRLKWRSVM